MGTPFVFPGNYLCSQATWYILWNHLTIREIYAFFPSKGKNDRKCKIQRFSSVAGIEIVKNPTAPRETLIFIFLWRAVVRREAKFVA
jgi:hypothetical protein